MKQTTVTSNNNLNINAVLIFTYKVTKKLIKLGLYVALIYFSYQGFMAWE